MRKINKGDALPEFENFREKNPGANWKDFAEGNHDIYVATREQILFHEQSCICGYTEMPINEFENARLDHYLKKDLFPRKTFNWDNLVAALINNDFGDHHKDNVHRIKPDEYKDILNPVEDRIEDYFEYNLRGEIEPKRELDPVLRAKVEKTVEVFNLHHDTLKKRRVDLIRQINAYSDLPKEEIRKWLSPSGFVSVIHQFTE